MASKRKLNQPIRIKNEESDFSDDDAKDSFVNTMFEMLSDHVNNMTDLQPKYDFLHKMIGKLNDLKDEVDRDNESSMDFQVNLKAENIHTLDVQTEPTTQVPLQASFTINNWPYLSREQNTSLPSTPSNNSFNSGQSSYFLQSLVRALIPTTESLLAIPRVNNNESGIASNNQDENGENATMANSSLSYDNRSSAVASGNSEELPPINLPSTSSFSDTGMVQQASEDKNNNGSNYNQGNYRRGEKHIKRPMNAFMIWSSGERSKILKQCPNLHNSDISKLLGQTWRAMPAEEKLPFYQKQNQLSKQHLKEHPDYRYKPRPKRTCLVDGKRVSLVQYKEIIKIRKESLNDNLEMIYPYNTTNSGNSGNFGAESYDDDDDDDDDDEPTADGDNADNFDSTL